MAQINRRPSAVRRAAIVDQPQTFEPQQQMPPQMQLEDMMDSFGPEGPPASFDPTTFKPSADYKPKTATWEPEKEEHPYLPGEDYFAFTKRMDKVFGRGFGDVPEPGDPDFTPTMIDMWAKMPAKDRFRHTAKTESGVPMTSGIIVPEKPAVGKVYKGAHGGFYGTF